MVSAERRKQIAYIEVTLAVIVWGISFIATKIALRQVAPVTVVWLRFGIGTLILGAAALLRRQRAAMNASDLGYLAVLGFLGITFHQWLQSTGLVTAQATTTAWIVATTPVFMVLLGWLALKERMNTWQIGGVALAGVGVLLVVTKGNLAGLLAGTAWTSGDLLILISAPNWAVFSTLSRRGLDRFPPTLMVAIVMLFGWLFSSVMFFAGPGLGDIARLGWDGWLGVIFLGVFCSGLAYIFWYDALVALPVGQAGAFVNIEPFVTVIVAALVLAEPLLLTSILGGSAILIGVYLVQTGRLPGQRMIREKAGESAPTD
jgi:drug/metabolite transporter (DMT)-like permease